MAYEIWFMIYVLRLSPKSLIDHHLLIGEYHQVKKEDDLVVSMEQKNVTYLNKGTDDQMVITLCYYRC